MERIKKTVLQILTTGTTQSGDIIITPDLTAVYYFKIGIIGVMKDVGFLDAYVEPPPPPEPPVPPVVVVTYYYIENDGDIFQDKDGANFIYQ